MSAELGGELVGDELHFLDCLDGEPARTQLRRPLQRQPFRVVVGAVDISAEVPHFLAAHVHGVRAGARGHDVGVERKQPEVVALLDRAGSRTPCGRWCSRPRTRSSARSALAGNSDGLLHRGELQREVQDDVLAGVEHEVLADFRGKAGQLDLML